MFSQHSHIRISSSKDHLIEETQEAVEKMYQEGETVRVKLLVFISAMILLIPAFGIFLRIERRSVTVMDELHMMESKPEVIIVDNGVFILESIPSIGRPVTRIMVKNTDFLYFNPSPTFYFDEETGYSVVEFGGLFFSIPWDPRSAQPYGSNYELIERENEVTVVCKGMNPTDKLFSEICVNVKDERKNVEIEINVTNLSDEDKSIQLPMCECFPFREDFYIVSSLKNINRLTPKDFPTMRKISLKAMEGYMRIFSKNLNKGLIGEFEGTKDHNLSIWRLNCKKHLRGERFLKVKHSWPVVRLKKSETRKFKYFLWMVDLQALERKCKERE